MSCFFCFGLKSCVDFPSRPWLFSGVFPCPSVWIVNVGSLLFHSAVVGFTSGFGPVRGFCCLALPHLWWVFFFFFRNKAALSFHEGICLPPPRSTPCDMKYGSVTRSLCVWSLQETNGTRLRAVLAACFAVERRTSAPGKASWIPDVGHSSPAARSRFRTRVNHIMLVVFPCIKTGKKYWDPSLLNETELIREKGGGGEKKTLGYKFKNRAVGKYSSLGRKKKQKRGKFAISRVLFC